MRSLLQHRAGSAASTRRAPQPTHAALRTAPTAAPLAMDSAAQQRAKAAVLGGMVADAATLPLHWIYDVPKISGLLAAKGREATPEFYPEPSCPYYKAALGDNSAYGDELRPLLMSMANNGGELDAVKYAEALHTFYTTTSPDSYKNASIRAFLEAMQAGKRGTECGHATDSQANCFCKVPILVARYAGNPVLLEKVEEAVRVQQNNDTAVKFGLAAAQILEKVVLGSSIADALAWAKGTPGAIDAEMQQLVAQGVEAGANPPKELTYEPASYMKAGVDMHKEKKDQLTPYQWATWCFGPACGNPAAFLNVVMTAAMFGKAGGGGYVAGVRANMTAGGDNASRSFLIGALLAAQDGLASIPAEWRAATAHYKDYEDWTDVLTTHK